MVTETGKVGPVDVLYSHRWQLSSAGCKRPIHRTAALTLQRVTFDEVNRRICLRFYSALDGGINAGLAFIQSLVAAGHDDLTITWTDAEGTPVNSVTFSGCRPLKHRFVADYCKSEIHTQTVTMSYHQMTQSKPVEYG